MSKNLTRKGLALATALSFGLTGLTALPSIAAAGDTVALAPATGTGYNTFVTDTLQVKATVDGNLLNDSALSKIQWKIASDGADVALTPSSFNVVHNAANTAAECEMRLTYVAYDSNNQVVGSTVNVVVDSTNQVTGTSVANCLTDLNADTLTLPAQTISWNADWAYIVLVDQAYSLVGGDAVAIGASNRDLVNNLGVALGNEDNDYADADAAVALTAWVETDADNTTVDANLSKTETINFYDPEDVSVISKVERTVATGYGVAATNGSTAEVAALNDHGQGYITGTLKFSKTVNLDQVDLTQWKYALDSSDNNDDVASVQIDLRASDEAFAIANAKFEVLTPAGFSSTNKSAYGALVFRGAVTGDALAVNETYKLSFRSNNDTSPYLDYASGAFEVVDNTTGTTADNIIATAASSTDASQTGTTVTARAGVGAQAYNLQVRTVADAALAAANVPVLAVVKANAVFPTGESIAVSGVTEKITKASGAVIATGLTDADGKWTVTVTSATSKSGQAYTVDYYVLLSTGAWSNVKDAANNAADYTTTYATAAATTLAADNSVLSGANPIAGFTVKDQFGQAISASSTGAAFSIELRAADKTKLDKSAAVAAGKASFTFANYLTAGGSDILTAKVFTGTSTAPTYVSGVTASVSLYNTNAVSAVNVVTEVTGVTVTYDDFITGASSATNVAPDDSSFTYTGTVVDSTGSGVPGAPVTISGKGFQFAKTGTTTYYVDSITLAASEAGTFSVTAYTHVASATGNVVTVTSEGKSASTKIKSAIPVDANGTDGSTGLLSAANLSLTWNIPAILVANTTYPITAKVTDKWGNAVKGASVTFSGYAAAQFNGAATATKTTGSAGTAVAYLRSLKDVDGAAAIALSLTDIDQDADAKSDSDNLAAVLTDATATKWNEAAWSNELTSEVNFLVGKPSAKITKAATSAAVVKNASGATVKIVRGTKSATKVASSNSFKISVKGGTGTVKVYVNGVKVASK